MRVLFVAAAAFLMSCGPSGGGPLTLSWAFADGRSCADSGVSKVAISADGAALLASDCSDGLWPANVQLAAVAAGAALDAVATSYSGTELDRGHATVDVTLMPLTITLSATGGR